MNETVNRILKNSSLNLIANVSQKIGQAATFILIARLLSQAETGAFNLATTYTAVFLAISRWGLDHLMIRDLARNRNATNQYLSNFFILRLLIASAIWLLLLLCAPLFPYTPLTTSLILIISFTIIPGTLTNLYYSIWISIENVQFISILIFAFSLVRFLISAALIWFNQSILLVGYTLVVLAILELVAYIVVTHKLPDLHGFRWSFDLSFSLKQIKVATPLILISFILLIEYQFDVLILSFFRTEAEVAIYGTAGLFLTLLLFITQSYQQAIFPLISQAYATDHNYLEQIYTRSLKYLVASALLISIPIFLFAKPLIVFVYDESYIAAAQILSVLLIAFISSAFNVPNSRVLIAANAQKVMVYFALSSMIANLLLTIYLVPRYGAIGTAWARVLSTPFYSIPAFIFVQYNICRFDWRIW